MRTLIRKSIPRVHLAAQRNAVGPHVETEALALKESAPTKSSVQEGGREECADPSERFGTWENEGGSTANELRT